MSYLRFDKTLMTNLEESLPREILRTNRSGAYHCSTIVDCNTRKYHGLLVIPVPELDDENHVLLSAMDETVIQHGAEFNLGLHKYHGDNFSPRGHKYIREYECEKVPTTWYRVADNYSSVETLGNSLSSGLIINYEYYNDTISICVAGSEDVLTYSYDYDTYDDVNFSAISQVNDTQTIYGLSYTYHDKTFTSYILYTLTEDAQ